MASTVELRAILRDEISAGLRGIQAELGKVGNEGTKAGAGVSSGMSTALPSVRGVTDALGAQTAALRMQRDAMKTEEYKAYAKQQREIKKEIEELEKANAGGASSFATMGNAVRGFMALQVVGYVKDATLAIFSATAEMQSMKMGLNAVMKSGTLATDELVKLKEVAKLPGLGYGEAVKMSISLQSAGMSADMARKAMMSFGNALATVGKGKADLDGVGLALSQIMSKGKVSAEEINQIAERVPQIRVAMQDAFGTASTEMIQKMGLSSGQFIRAITEELSKLEKVTGGLKNGAENLSDQWTALKVNIGGSGSAFQVALDGMSGMVSGANALVEKYREIKKAGVELRERETYTKLKDKENSGEKLDDDEKRTLQIVTRHLKERAKIENDAYKARLAKENELSDGQKELEKRAAQIKKKTREEDLKFAEVAHNLDIRDANKREDSLEQAKELHRARLAEINEKWDKKAKKQAAAKEDPEIKIEEDRLATAMRRADKITQIRQKQARDDAADLAKRRADDIAEDKRQAAAGQKENEAAIAQARRVLNAKKKFEDEWEAYQEEKQLHNAKMVEGAWMSTASQMQGVFSSAFQEIGKKHGDMMQVMVDGFTNMLNQMLAELAANAAIFGLLSLFAPAGMAASFAGGAGGLTGAIFGQKPTGMKATGGNVGGGSYLIGERGPELFRPTVPGRVINNSTANTYGGVTVHVHGGGNVDPNAIAQSIIRAQAKQSTRRLGGSF